MRQALSWIAPRMEEIRFRHEELTRRLGEPEVVSDRKLFPQLSKEYAQLDPIVRAWQECESIQIQMHEAEELLESDDGELKDLGRSTLDDLQPRLQQASDALELMLLPPDPTDGRSAYLEIRAGTGGKEAALFAADLLQMYQRYAAARGWNEEILSSRPSESDGYWHVICRLDGQGVYERLKFESGAHRVQRVPKTESQGRIHTSACTVAVIAEADPVDEIEIDSKDLRVETFKSSGKGGQHVNKTDSAVRLTHKPSGVVVECQEERSQHMNRARAMALLQAKLFASAREKQESEESALRKALVGSGDRSQRIRTYNFPQGRVTDHRANITLYKLDDVLEGSLDDLIDVLVKRSHAERLSRVRSQGRDAASA